ncbi:MAG: hypothetical protein M1814_002441 [Vezdaea aestivalis]|nr:MAG: hypothetical protein M1814_002441 [Vezdaea aestivalis]
MSSPTDLNTAYNYYSPQDSYLQLSGEGVQGVQGFPEYRTNEPTTAPSFPVILWKQNESEVATMSGVIEGHVSSYAGQQPYLTSVLKLDLEITYDALLDKFTGTRRARTSVERDEGIVLLVAGFGMDLPYIKLDEENVEAVMLMLSTVAPNGKLFMGTAPIRTRGTKKRKAYVRN